MMTLQTIHIRKEFSPSIICQHKDHYRLGSHHRQSAANQLVLHPLVTNQLLPPPRVALGGLCIGLEVSQISYKTSTPPPLLRIKPPMRNIVTEELKICHPTMPEEEINSGTNLEGRPQVLRHVLGKVEIQKYPTVSTAVDEVTLDGPPEVALVPVRHTTLRRKPVISDRFGVTVKKAL